MNRARNSIATRPLPPFPNNAKARDFGSHGKMTVRQASVMSGICMTTIYQRMLNGVKGDAILEKYVPAPPHPATRKRELNYSSGGISESFYQGVLMHKMYGDKVPDVKTLINDMGYTTATAYRRLQAYRAALGLP